MCFQLILYHSGILGKDEVSMNHYTKLKQKELQGTKRNGLERINGLNTSIRAS